MGKIFSIVNQKGGVGKTTTVVNIGAGLGKLGKNVLLVDIDPQANLTSSLGIKQNSLENTVHDLLNGYAGFEEIVISRGNLDIIPSSLALSGADMELANVVGRERLLKEVLDTVSGRYDYILIDCSPSLGLLALNALVASQGVLIPMQAGYLPLEGIGFLLQTIDIVKERLNSELKVEGVIVTMYDSRQKLQKEVVEIIKSHFGEKVFNTFIRNNVHLAEAPGFGMDIYTYKPSSQGAENYMNLCKEILNRGVI